MRFDLPCNFTAIERSSDRRIRGIVDDSRGVKSGDGTMWYSSKENTGSFVKSRVDDAVKSIDVSSIVRQ